MNHTCLTFGTRVGFRTRFRLSRWSRVMVDSEVEVRYLTLNLTSKVDFYLTKPYTRKSQRYGISDIYKIQNYLSWFGMLFTVHMRTPTKSMFNMTRKMTASLSSTFLTSLQLQKQLRALSHLNGQNYHSWAIRTIAFEEEQMRIRI